MSTKFKSILIAGSNQGALNELRHAAARFAGHHLIAELENIEELCRYGIPIEPDVMLISSDFDRLRGFGTACRLRAEGATCTMYVVDPQNPADSLQEVDFDAACVLADAPAPGHVPL